MPSRPPLPLPIDPAPLRDVARSLQFAAERGSRSLRRGLPLDALPEPAARLADTAFATAQRLGEGVSHLAHVLLDDDAGPLPLGHTEAEACTRFAAAAYDGLQTTLRRLGAESCLVSEAAAQRAWRRVAAGATGRSDSATAAALYRAMAEAAVVRECVWPEGASLPVSEAVRIATFAVLLAMLADAPGFRDLLPAAVDLTLALRDDLASANDAALERLFDEFRDHV